MSVGAVALARPARPCQRVDDDEVGFHVAHPCEQGVEGLAPAVEVNGPVAEDEVVTPEPGGVDAVLGHPAAHPQPEVLGALADEVQRPPVVGDVDDAVAVPALPGHDVQREVEGEEGLARPVAPGDQPVGVLGDQAVDQHDRLGHVHERAEVEVGVGLGDLLLDEGEGVAGDLLGHLDLRRLPAVEQQPSRQPRLRHRTAPAAPAERRRPVPVLVVVLRQVLGQYRQPCRVATAQRLPVQVDLEVAGVEARRERLAPGGALQRVQRRDQAGPDLDLVLAPVQAVPEVGVGEGVDLVLGGALPEDDLAHLVGQGVQDMEADGVRVDRLAVFVLGDVAVLVNQRFDPR